MNFNKEDYIRSYRKYLIDLVQEFLRDDIYESVSSAYLMGSIHQKQFEFVKKYFQDDDSINDNYNKLIELSELLSDYSDLSFSIIFNYYHNKVDFRTNSTLNSNYFKDNLRFFDINNGTYHSTYAELNQVLLNSCNTFLLEDRLKQVDVYTLRNETVNLIESDFSFDKNDFSPIVITKIDNIFIDTLRLFETENKNFKQLFEYIPFSKNDELSKYQIFCEMHFKKDFLPLILNLRVGEAQSLFTNISENYFKEHANLYQNSDLKVFVESIEKWLPSMLYDKHIEININLDEL